MDMTGQILSGLFGVAIVLMIAPRVFTLNRGRTLQNIALWVAVFLGLALAYKTIGPGKNDPLSLQTPPTVQEGDSIPQTEIREEDGFSPPRE